MSDNELDNLFKEAADGFKVPHDPSAWKDMSGKLDRDTPGGAFWNWKSSTLTSVLVVSGLALIWYWSSSAENEIAELQTSTSVELIESGNKAERPSDKKTDETILSDQQKQIERGVTVKNDQTPRNESPANKQTGGSKSFGSIADSKRSIVDSKNGANPSGHQAQMKSDGNETSQHVQDGTLSRNLADSKITQSEPRTIQTTDVDGLNSAEASANSKSNRGEQHSFQGLTTGEIAFAKHQQLEPYQNAKTVEVTSLLEPDVKASQSDGTSDKAKVSSEFILTDSIKIEEEASVRDSTQVAAKKKKIKEDHDSSGKILSVKLAVAPDYTSVENVSPNGLGVSYGMLIEYQFNPHWSVATGAIWSKKIYSAEDVKYNGYTADQVDGDCRMWDIPLNVYYHFTPGRKLSLYTGIGFSSYLMNEENYTFYYETSYGTYDYDRQIKGENNEWFKTLNISIGMQYKMNNRFSLQLEPILKAPLAGVGEGEVSLVSLGAFLNLRYNFLIKNGLNQ